MAAISTKSVLRRVAKAVEKIKNDETATIATMSAGDCVRQGDCYVICLDAPPKESGPYAGRQLAPGSTQGSRHTAKGDCRLYTPDERSALAILARLIPATKGQEHFLGPVVDAPSPWTIAHPEHGDRVLPAGTYLVTYQRSWAQGLRRQAD